LYWLVLKNIYPGDPQLIENARLIAKQLGKHNFNGSNGRLGKGKARYSIKRVKICGEYADLQRV